MEKKVFNLIILDESGSMEIIEKSTVLGLSETIQTIKGAQKQYPEQQHFISLMSFNSRGEKFNYHYDCKPVADIGIFEGKDYCPNGCTPLYDAIGCGLARLRRQISDEDQVLVTIITDGLENDSHEYDFDSICSLIDKVKSHGWMVTYIGANQDAIKEAHEMHIDNGLNYDATPEGVSKMMSCERLARRKFYEVADKCKASKLSAESVADYNYFSKDDKDKDHKDDNQ